MFYLDSNLQSVPDIANMLNNISCIKNKYNVVATSLNGSTCYIHCPCNRDASKSLATKNTTYISVVENKDKKRALSYWSSMTRNFCSGSYIRTLGIAFSIMITYRSKVIRYKKEQSKRIINQDVLQDLENMLLMNVPNSIVKELIQLKTGHALSKASLTKLKQTMVINRFKHSENESTGDIMLHVMEDNPILLLNRLHTMVL